jgi:ABC-type phosphate transport system substrate-binding protein
MENLVNMPISHFHHRLLVLLIGFLGCWSMAAAQDVVLVVNKNVQISQISEADLRAIFLGEKSRFADGSHAVPVTLKGGSVYEVFVQKHLGGNPDDLRAQWRKLVFTGHGAMPKTFDSEAALIGYVNATPGAIGYVSRVSSKDNLKCLPIVH